MTLQLDRDRPRVLHVTTTAMSLGWLLEPQLRAFKAAGFDVVTASAPGQIAERLEASGLAHIAVDAFDRGIDYSADIRAARELRAVIDHCAPDIIHTHNPKPGVMGRILGRVSRVPLVVNTVHGLYAQPTDGFRRRLAVYGAERLAAQFSHAELVQSIEDVETLLRLGVPRERVHLLGNGIDLERFRTTEHTRERASRLRRELGIEAGVPIIGTIGRLVWEKGYRDLFKAVEQLRASSPHRFAVVVVGPREPSKADGIADGEIERMAGLGVHFIGPRNDVEDLLAMFDLFILSSRREGFPRALMEACAMGVPVIATNVRGCRQVVRHGYNGFLYEPGAHRALSASISRLLDDELTRRRFGEAGAIRAQVEFDQQRVIDRTLSVYRSLLRSRTDRYNDSIDLVAEAASKREREANAPADSLSRSA